MNAENNTIEQASRQKSLKGEFTASFIIQKNKLRADGSAPIFARIIVNGKMTHMSTHQTILPERWSTELQRTLGQTRSEKDINEYLNTFMVAIQKRYIDTMLRDADLSSHMIKSSLLNAPEDGAIKNILELCDFFIFSCYTALPYIDLYKLNYDQIIVWGDGSNWISIVRQKTKVPSNIRLLEVPLRLIEKYRGQAKDNKVFPVPSNQKMNDYLKEIGPSAGFLKSSPSTWHATLLPLQSPWATECPSRAFPR